MLNDKWLKKYVLVKIYCKKLKTNKVPFNYEEQGLKLGLWLANQKKAYIGIGNYDLDIEQIKLLDDINIKWFSYSKNRKLKNEIITKNNKNRKEREILNRFRSYLNSLNTLPTKEEINNGFIKVLSKGDKYE